MIIVSVHSSCLGTSGKLNYLVLKINEGNLISQIAQTYRQLHIQGVPEKSGHGMVWYGMESAAL